jgi:hypothetical protein
MDILALDLATVSGWARGCVGDHGPRCGTLAFSPKGESSENAVFGRALPLFQRLLHDDPTPDLVILEAMLPPAAMKGRTSRAVRDRLAGLHGIARAVAYHRGIYRIETATVSDVRAHFLSDRGLRRASAKREVTAVCQRLGWTVANDNEADACALWSYACGLLDPRTALRVSPLFRPKGGVAI